MSSILITGGAGFIGSNTIIRLLTGHLAEEVYSISVVDNFTTGSMRNLEVVKDKIQIFKADIRNIDEVGKIIRERNINRILHLAAIVSLQEANENPLLAVETNVNGTLNLLELARKYDVEKFVYASSVAVYGEPQKLPIKEDHPTCPVNLYGLTKLMGERVVIQYFENYGLDTVALRYFNVYGPRMRGGPYGSVIHNFITSLMEGRRPVIYGDGAQTRDFVYVMDVAEANIRALFSSNLGGAGDRVFNIGTGVETKIIDLYKMIASIMGVKIKPIFKPPRKGDIKRSLADYRLARERLAWSPQVNLGVGIKNTVKWYMENH